MKHAELQEWRRTFRMEDKWWVLAGKAVLPEPRSLQEIAQLSAEIEQGLCVMHIKYAHTSHAKWIRYEPGTSIETKNLPTFEPIPAASQKELQQEYEKPRPTRAITEDQLKFIIANKLATEEQAHVMMRNEASSLIRSYNRKKKLLTTFKILAVLAAILAASAYLYLDRLSKEEDTLAAQQNEINKAETKLTAFETRKHPSTPLVDAIQAGEFTGTAQRTRLAGKVNWDDLKEATTAPPEIHLLNEFNDEALEQVYRQNQTLLALLKPSTSEDALKKELAQLKEHLPPPLKNVYDDPIPYIYSPFRPYTRTFLPKEAFSAEWIQPDIPIYEEYAQDLKPANLKTLETAINTLRGKVKARLKRNQAQAEPSEEQTATNKWLENAMLPYLDMLTTFNQSSAIRKMNDEQRAKKWETYLSRDGKHLENYIKQHTMFTTQAQQNGTYLISSIKEEHLVAQFDLGGYKAYFPNQGTQPVTIAIEQRQPIQAETRLSREQIVLRVIEKISHPAQRRTRTLPLGEKNIELVYEQDPRFYIVCNERNLNQAYLFKVPQWIYEKVTVGSNIPSSDYDKLWLVPQIPKQDYPEGFK